MAGHWSDMLDTTLNKVWHLLLQGLSDRHAPARYLSLATIGAHGHPELRTVVLRALDRFDATLDFHTDSRSNKVAELQREPHASLHVWDDATKLQIRLRVVAELGAKEENAETWAKVPQASQKAYGACPSPGTPIAQPNGFEITPDPARFTIVRCTVQEIETLWLGTDFHRRALFRRSEDWTGQWLVP